MFLLSVMGVYDSKKSKISYLKCYFMSIRVKKGVLGGKGVYGSISTLISSGPPNLLTYFGLSKHPYPTGSYVWSCMPVKGIC